MPCKDKKDTAQQRAVKEAKNYLGGELARSASRNGALLARYRGILRELLGLALEMAGESLAEGDEGGAWSVLGGLQEKAIQLFAVALTDARLVARAEALAELNLLAPGLSLANGAQTGDRENDDAERIGQWAARFMGDLGKEIKQRFWTAKLMGEDARTAAASLTSNTLAGRAIEPRYGKRLETAISTEWRRASNEERWRTLVFAKKYLPDLKVKYVYFDEARCDGSCLKWATGGLQKDGVYELSSAPMPIGDTHPNCRCILAPWLPGRGIVDLPVLHDENQDILKGIGEGFLDSINPLEIWRGLEATYCHIADSRNRWLAIKDLGKGIGTGLLQSVTDLWAFDTPRKQGRAIGGLIPDIVLSFVGGIGAVKAGLKSVTTAGEGARIVGRAERALQEAGKAAKVAEEAAARARKLTAHALGSIGERKLAEWLEKSGRKLILDPRKRPLTASGPDAITVIWKDGECVVEFWDNKAWTSSRTASGSSALERIGSERGSLKRTLESALEKSNLPETEIKRIKSAINNNNIAYDRVISNAGGNARSGATLEKKGIRFEPID